MGGYSQVLRTRAVSWLTSLGRNTFRTLSSYSSGVPHNHNHHLNHNQVATLTKLYRSWEDNPDVGFAIVKGSGRAFAAGGDVVALYHLLNKVDEGEEHNS